MSLLISFERCLYVARICKQERNCCKIRVEPAVSLPELSRWNLVRSCMQCEKRLPSVWGTLSFAAASIAKLKANQSEGDPSNCEYCIVNTA